MEHFGKSVKVAKHLLLRMKQVLKTQNVATIKINVTTGKIPPAQNYSSWNFVELILVGLRVISSLSLESTF